MQHLCLSWIKGNTPNLPTFHVGRLFMSIKRGLIVSFVALLWENISDIQVESLCFHYQCAQNFNIPLVSKKHFAFVAFPLNKL